MADKPILEIVDLQVHYGESHAIQGVSLTLERGILALVGRNGMGKTTLCNTIVGLKQARSGSIRIDGREITRMSPHQINRLGVGFVPQGRRVWPSLTVDETLRLAARGGNQAAWTPERIYQTFPRLGERKSSGGAQLSGGEQQMLAISRALLSNPKLLIMDEPTEGLAPLIVEQVEAMLTKLAREENISVLLVEQNIGVATAVAEQVAIMVNGRIARLMESRALAADRELQQRLLGVGRHGEEEAPVVLAALANTQERVAQVFRIERQSAGEAAAGNGQPVYRASTSLPNRWGIDIARSAGGPAPAAEDAQAKSSPFPSPSASAVPRSSSAPSTRRALSSAISATGCARSAFR
jgi:ABC-type branched-subunit amino acid transport system ATPase component